MENYQTPEGLKVPEVLIPYMGGIDFIPYNENATKAYFKAREEEKARTEAKTKGKAAKGGNAKTTQPANETTAESTEEAKKE